ncbi:hypothetical protein VOLCADRAFT_98486 [Volvox carteri f. nagariensis]|uniref:Uncharacterized protein n=1 Tax=Volvox carteri f. nagariensis TaxID=3068 RepID=D8UFG6_VOLCA|nr:uncharacterized protein VOLCADRAFT_98486 [Volvox carteri f. nagariensis]EFJ41499.1 hypothetical protein VOLCADRAFT_98486 [Volvox carteri f. nagariensis]|eukprot:XP_002957444.1 hypothetical protein VOLCADRAFT_98486 [Volvox carteri f. nagariensis]
MERGAMVGAGQYSLTKTSSNANALQLPGPLARPPPPQQIYAQCPKLCLAAAADGANRIPSPVHSPLRSPSSSLGPAAGSLKLFCSGVVGGIDRCPSPGPCSSPRQSLTLFPGREESAAVAAAAAAASPGESVPSPQRSDATAAAAAAASSPSSSPGRQGWLEKVYSAKSLSAPSAAAAGDDVVSGVGVGAGAGGELVSPGRGVSAPACRSPRGSPGRNTRGIGHAHTDAASPSLPSRMTGASRTTTPLQCLYGPTPTQAPLAVVASASEDWSEAATGTGDGGGAGPRESLAVREGLRAYLMLSPPSPSASVSAVTLAAAAATGNSPLASNSSLGERSAGGSPRRGSPAAIAAAASAALSRSSSVSSVHLTPAASPGRQAVVAPAVQQVTGAAAAATADVMSYPCAPPPRSPSRSAGELSDRSSTTSPVAGSGSAVLVRGPHGSPALASATGKISPVASQPSAGGGFGRDGRTAAAASAAGQRSPASAPQPRQRQQKGGGGGGSSGGGVRREELLDEEEDPAVVGRSASRRTSGSASGGGGGGSGGGGSIPSVPSTLAASISSRRAWHREGPPEEWWTAKLAKADAERRKREAQLAADLRYLQQIRTRTTEVQHTHEALLAQSEEALRAARSAKASTEAQHRWLQYQDAVAEGARRHFEHLTNHN